MRSLGMLRSVGLRAAAAVPVARRLASSSTTTTGDVGVAAAAGRVKRAEEIRQREVRMRWARMLVIPAFTLYGLFILRPTDGHLLRYIAERRHHEPYFNDLFPPLALPEGSSSSGGGGRPAPNSAAERAWMKSRLRADSAEDEARLARRKLLFSREQNYAATPDEAGQVPTFVKSAQERQRELEDQRWHPPMHLLSDQLNAIVARSREYHAAVVSEGLANTGSGGGGDKSTGVASKNVVKSPALVAPPIELVFHDRTFFATAAINFNDTKGQPVKTLRFIGACGMMWKQVSS